MKKKLETESIDIVCYEHGNCCTRRSAIDG